MKFSSFGHSLLAYLAVAVLASHFFDSPRAHAAEGEAKRLRLCSYNLEFFDKGTAAEIAAMLQPRNFDVIAIQEIPRKEGYESTDDLRDALNAAEERAGGKTRWVSVEGKIGSGNDARKFKSILCRVPLAEFSELDLHDGGWPGGSAVRAAAEFHGKKIAVYSLHVPGVPANKKKLVEHPTLQNDKADVVFLMGDFNERLDRDGDKFLRAAGYVPTWEALKFDVADKKTYHALDPNVSHGVIDHIYFPQGKVKVIDGGIIELEKPLADHHPIWAEIELLDD